MDFLSLIWRNPSARRDDPRVCHFLRIGRLMVEEKSAQDGCGAVVDFTFNS